MTLSLISSQIRRLSLQAKTVVVLAGTFVSARGLNPPASSVHFEVVSIRPSKAEGFFRNFNINPDGYRTHGQTIGDTIAFAYYPAPSHYWQGKIIKSYPSEMDEKYDIEAKVQEKDIAVWQTQGPDVPLLRAALREMLEDRCKLKLHMEQGRKVSVLELVVLKSKPNGLKPYDVSEAVPSGAIHFSNYPAYPAKLIPGQSPTKFFNASMAALAYVLCSPGSPVYDATGLPGTYDFQLARDAAIPAGPNESGSPARFRIEDLGLGLRGSSREMPTIVIDHYEKPSPN